MSFRIGSGLLTYGDTSPITFVTGRSKLLNISQDMASTHTAIAGRAKRVDRAGRGIVPTEIILPYEYLILPVTALSDVQTEYDSIMDYFNTYQTGTLTTFGVGDVMDVISGVVRVEHVVEVDGEPNHKRLQITFFAEDGMS